MQSGGLLKVLPSDGDECFESKKDGGQLRSLFDLTVPWNFMNYKNDTVYVYLSSPCYLFLFIRNRYIVLHT